jgi:hypothetical protein
MYVGYGIRMVVLIDHEKVDSYMKLEKNMHMK